MDGPVAPLAPDPPLAAYAPYYRPDIQSVRIAAYGGEPIFAVDAVAELMRSLLRRLRDRHPFTTLGWTILPTQVWLLVRPGPGTEIAWLMEQARRRFRREYAEIMGMPGEVVVWEAEIPVRRMQDLADFARTLDAIHYAAVAQDLVPHPEDWPRSSYPVWVERRLYKLGWGWVVPERLRVGG